MMKPVALVLAVLLAAQPALAQGSVQGRMAGIWFGSGQPGDQSQMYIDHFNADGSFRSDHRMCRMGKAFDVSESGRWNMAGNVLVIDIAISGGQKQPRTDRYRVNAVDGKRQDYTLLSNNFNYKARKVDAKFPMPPCDLSS